MVDWLQLVLGGLVLWAPGLTWTWALVPELDWAQFLAVSVVAALTVGPGAMYLLNVFLGFPITPTNATLLSLALASLGAAWAIRPRLEKAWS